MTAAPASIGFGPDEEIDPVVAKRMAELLRAVRLTNKCFDIARSTRFAGEREAAVSRGIAIAKKARLRLELFDIPGHDEHALHVALRDIDETFSRLAANLHAEEGETIYDAKRRAFHEATRAAAERDKASGRRTSIAPDLDSIHRAALVDRWPSPGAALNALRARRVRLHPIDPPGATIWIAPGRSPDVLDEWQLRELADEVCA
ncbi:hypothetical protein DMC47_10390 [Nostoc sp. 3335mG]|nr:hypothetical protein DMC47_10390 [Nostoc sp. 3335mG]